MNGSICLLAISLWMSNYNSNVQVEKAQAAFYELDVPQEQGDCGFIIGASSSTGSKFKLLLFEQRGDDSRWELHTSVILLS